MILVDTSAWIEHFRRRDAQLVDLLASGAVATCAVVRAELRLGSGIPAAAVPLLARLPEIEVPGTAAAVDFLDEHGPVFAGSGIGFADLLIVACAAGSGARLRTADRRLAAVWRRLGFRTA